MFASFLRFLRVLRIAPAIMLCAANGPGAGYIPPAEADIRYDAAWHTPALHVYRVVPRSFSTGVVSAAVALAGLTTNDLVSAPQGAPKGFLRYVHRGNGPWAVSEGPNIGCSIDPRSGTIICEAAQESSPGKIPNEQAVLRIAERTLAKLDIGREQVEVAGYKEKRCDSGAVCARSVAFARVVDGIPFYATPDFVSEGLFLEAGTAGNILQCELIWPNLEQIASWRMPAPGELMESVKSGEFVLSPIADSTARGKTRDALNNARRLVITAVNVYYSPAQDEKTIAPFIVIDVRAEGAFSRNTARLFRPVDVPSATQKDGVN
jgi:hypothetical protein